MFGVTGKLIIYSASFISVSFPTILALCHRRILYLFDKGLYKFRLLQMAGNWLFLDKFIADIYSPTLSDSLSKRSAMPLVFGTHVVIPSRRQMDCQKVLLINHKMGECFCLGHVQLSLMLAVSRLRTSYLLTAMIV